MAIKSKLSREDLQNLYFEQHLSLQQIATAVSSTQATISRTLIRYGLKPRTKVEAGLLRRTVSPKVGPTLSREEYLKKYRIQNLERLRQYDCWRSKELPERIKYRLEYGKKYYNLNKERIRERCKKYNATHLDQQKAFIAAWRSSLFGIWGISGKPQSQNECRKRGLEAQRLGSAIVKGLGYEVLPIAEQLPMFPIDIIAKKDGVLYGIEVSIYPRKKFKLALLLFLKFINAHLLCLFIRPNYNDYYLVEVNGTSTISVPKKIVIQGGTLIDSKLYVSF